MKTKLLYLFIITMLTHSFINAQDYALEFDGISNRVRYDTDASLDNLLNNATDYTIELWVKPTSTDIHNNVLLRRWNQFSITMYQDANKRFYFTRHDENGSSTFVNTIDNALVIGEWNHIAVINNSIDNSIKLYANGVDVTLSTHTAVTLVDTPSASNFYVGYGGSGTVPTAYLDKIRVKNTAEDITSLNTTDVTVENLTTDANTAILMNFNEGSGTTTVNEANSVDANLQCAGGCAELPTWVLLSSTLSVDNNNTIDFSIYPNPIKTDINIQTQGVLKKVMITDILGKIVFNKTYNAGNIQNKIDASNFNAGTYLITVETNNGLATKKLIIK